MKFYGPLLLLGSLLTAEVHGQRGCPRPTYSPFQYWTPTLVRWTQTLRGRALSVYPPDYHPYPGNHGIYYHCPGVEPEARYLNTGLPYDPHGPFAVTPKMEPSR